MPSRSKKRQPHKTEKNIRLMGPGNISREIKPSQLQAQLNVLTERNAWREVFNIINQLGEQRLKYSWAANAFFKALEATEQKQALLKETESAVLISPRDPGLLSWQAHALRLNGRVDESITILHKAIKNARPDADLFNSLGSALKEVGQFEEAKVWFEKAIKIKPGLAKAYWNVSDLVTDHSAEIAAIEIQLAKVKADNPEKYLLHFSLYRHYENLQNFGPAFENLEQANRLKNKQINYHASEGHELTERIIKTFTDKDQLSGNSENSLESTLEKNTVNNTKGPIFIFGLPRSGTTLIEQILASHSEVYGANELTFLNDAGAMVQSQKRLAGLFPDWTKNLNQAGWRQIGANYLKLIGTLPTDKTKITDKSLLNFRAAGLIARALPQAKMIHVIRDPMDKAFGCYRQNFGTGLLFSYDFNNIADMILDGQSLARHWQKTLPKNQYYLLDYQALVHNPKEQIAKLLAFCELSDEEACYHPEKTERTVRTLSATQVRKPISTSALGAWKRYETQLQPMQDALKQRNLI